MRKEAKEFLVEITGSNYRKSPKTNDLDLFQIYTF